MKAYGTSNAFGLSRVAMTRAEFLRTLSLGAAGIAGTLAGVGRVASAAPAPVPAEAEVDVYPTGQFPVDVDEIRAAVNGNVGPSGRVYPGGGIVRLKATNEFGVPMYFNLGGGVYPAGRGSVEISRDVTIVGERTVASPMAFPNGKAPDADFTPDRTVVYGGKRAFTCTQANPFATRLTVRNIYFAYPSLAAIQVRKSAGLEVSDCVIYDVEWDDTGAGFKVAVGIEATGATQLSPELVGDYRVMNNRIRRAAPTISPLNFYVADSGIVMNLSSMTGTIVANEIDRFPFGIVADRNKGTVTVAGNSVSRCGYGAYPIACGIGARGTSMPVFIERNHVTGGIVAPGLRSKNGFTLASSNVLLRSNIVEGRVLSDGILLAASPIGGTTYVALDNRIEKNRLTELVAGRAQVFVDSGCNGNRFANNEYGAVDRGGMAGMVVHSSRNQLVNEDFWGTYSGVTGTERLPCVWLKPGSDGNAVSALKYQGAPQGFDVCSQLLDEGTNAVHGYERCLHGIALD